MDNIEKNQMSPVAAPGSMVCGENYRFTVLTERMIRMEYSESGDFVDQATQTVLNRSFELPDYEVIESEDQLEIVTDYLHVIYDKKKFSRHGLTVRMSRNKYLKKMETWFYGDTELLAEENLRGTTSTLDKANGDMYYRNTSDPNIPQGVPDYPIDLGMGLMCKMGFSLIDDSGSLLLNEDGSVEPAHAGHIDQYFLCYGRDYLGCLKDFYHLSGKTPLLPRFVLGNWWSRYYSYTQDEYMDLLNRFRDENLPIAVAVQDMGWHITDIDPKYGKGWTGYTWNRELFPDPEGMMDEIHRRGMHFSLNVHPADGVRAYEEMYEDMAKELGVDYKNERPIEFEVTSKRFWDAYFKYLHHPNEEAGVDFWWIDWQQGSNSRAKGYDPLWMLNHFHYLDSGRNGKRPLTFSRYAGLGSHRYPIGFSGSTHITWASLDFQPYFTINASNVGYGWWSHDIGGHRSGYRDDELTTRWIQFGVFSPIMRLHSSNEVFTGKEPWKFRPEARTVMSDFLRLRHRLVPYIYTMNERFYKEDIPLIQPMYYQNPDREDAYQVKNEYYFGSELIVNPITSKSVPELGLGRVKTWLPEGTWIDFFTGTIYDGNRMMEMFRPLDSIPVLAKAGAIVPMQDAGEISSRTDNPKHLEVRVFAGADGSFRMYEDDGESNEYLNGKYAKTPFTLQWNKTKAFRIGPVTGDASLIPGKRTYTLKFYGIKNGCISNVRINGQEQPVEEQFDAAHNIVTIGLENVEPNDTVEIVFCEDAKIAANNTLDMLYEALNRTQMLFALKEKSYALVKNSKSLSGTLLSLQAMPMTEDTKLMIQEILLAKTDDR